MSGNWSSPVLRALSLGYRLRAVLDRRRGDVLQAERQRALFYEKAWREAASTLGARVEALGRNILEITQGGVQTRVCLNHTPFDDPVTLMLAGDKAAVYRMLAPLGLPVPRHLSFSLEKMPSAFRFLKEAEGLCVVKPARGTGAGAGVATGISSRPQLMHASLAASAFCPDLLLEEEIVGGVYRLLYLDGVLLDAVLRRPPTVTGDGRSTILELLQQENRERLARGYAVAQVLLSFDADMRRTLSRQGLSPRSVPAAGARVALKTVINENAARENEPVSHLFSDKVIEAGAQAARTIGCRLAGVDLVTPDPSRPLSDTGGVILEVNTTPGYYYHYYRKGARSPVAMPILKRLCEVGAADKKWKLS